MNRSNIILGHVGLSKLILNSIELNIEQEAQGLYAELFSYVCVF